MTLRILDQTPGPDGTMRVTFALPGPRRATVTVPYSSWLNGDHLAIYPLLVEQLASFSPLPRPPHVPPPT